MKSKTNKVKWTKKFKALIISLSLVFAVALGGACAAIGLTVENNKRFGTPVAGGVADENTPQLPEAAETFYAGATVGETTYTTNAEAWAAAINYSIENSVAVQFDLKTSWTADVSSGFGAATETNSPFGAAGSLNVPEGASVILNISKNVKLDRNLADAAGAETSNAIVNGNVITVSGGTLYLSGNGTITGGNNLGDGTGSLSVGGGGVNVETGTFNMYGGIFTNNYGGQAGGGVRVANGTFNMYEGTITKSNSIRGAVYTLGSNATFNMYGGKITENDNLYGGGLVAVGFSTFNMYGGTISNNNGTRSGGGVRFSDGTFNMYGGTISNNTSAEGGGISLSNTCTAVITGGTITKNTSTLNGGGVSVGAGGTLTINGGTISGNTAATGGGVYVDNGTVTINEGALIDSNEASSDAGGLYINNIPKSTEEGSTGSDAADTEYKIDETKVHTISGGVISNNLSRGRNGGVHMRGGVLNMTGGSITGNENLGSGNGGGGIRVTLAKFNFSGGFISDNESSTGGGGIVVTAGELNMSDTAQIINNKSKSLGGGGVFLQGDTFSEVTIGAVLTMSGGIISGNTSASDGGGVYCDDDSTVSMTGGTISKNTATKNGGGIFATSSEIEVTNEDGTKTTVISNSTATISGGEISGNTAAVGGGIYSSGTLNINGGTISDNTSGVGAGVMVECGTLNMTDGTVTGNYIPGGAGGGICTMGNAERPTTGTISGGTISHNRLCDYNGGAGIYVAHHSTLTLTGGTITRNIAGTGAGIYVETTGTLNMGVENADGTYSGNAVIEENASVGDGHGHGGGIVVNAARNAPGTFNMYSGIIRNNTATHHGGGVRVNGNGAIFTMKGGEISGNTASGEGGGIYNGGVMTVTGGTISGNESENGGGGICNVATLDITGITIDGNTANNGGGIYHNIGTLNLTGVTITDNEALNDGGGVYQNEGTTDFYSKTVIKDNTSSNFTNNLYRAATSGSLVARSLTSDSEIWISAASSMAVINVPSSALAARVFNDNPTYWNMTNVSNTAFGANARDVRLDLKTNLGTNAERWQAAVTKSINNKTTELFELTSDWKVATQNSAAGFGSGTAFAAGGLSVPTGANIILDLKSFTIDRNCNTAIGSVIYVYGKLTIKGNGTIKGGYNSSGGAGGIRVDGTLILNGGTISGNTSTMGGGVRVNDGASFTMNGGTISGNRAQDGNGGGVYVSENGTFIMNGGVIGGSVANAASSIGGGVYSRGTFKMNGGTISFNTTSYAGGVHVYNGSTFEMSGGHISNNVATGSGGGVYVGEGAEFTMSGGTISDNTANADGGGIFNAGTLTVSGAARITGNTASNADATKGSGGGIMLTYNSTMTMNGGTISGNTTAGSGGGICVASSAKLIMTDGTISGNESPGCGGGIYAAAQGEKDNNGNITTYGFTMSGGTINGNSTTTSSSSGGGVYVDGGTFIMTGGEISGNTSVNGGGVYVNTGATFTMGGGKISGNTSAHQGGGVWVGGATLTIKDGKIDGNIAKGDGNPGGGGLFTSGTTVIMEGGSISNNISEGGAGLYLLTTQFTMYGGVFSGNKSYIGGDTTKNRGLGGAVALVHSTFTMTSKEVNGVKTYGIIENNSANRGGAFYLCKSLDSLDEQKLIIEAGIIRNNDVIDSGSSTGCGGAIFLTDNSTITLSGGTISGNTATSSGGGVFVSTGATFTMTGGTISGNSASNYGGGILVEGKLTINDGIIERNTAVVRGGAICCSGTTDMLGGKILNNTVTNTDGDALGGGVCITALGLFTISGNALISGNTTAGRGGGILSSGTLIIEGGTISENTAKGSGGGLYNSGTFTMNDGTIDGNSAVYGGGVANIGTFTMNGGIISANIALNNSGGVSSGGEGTFTMNGGTIDGNSAVYGGGVYIGNTFELKAGTISNNTAAESGGGICVDGTVNVYGGTGESEAQKYDVFIKGNSAKNGGGICVGSNSGAAVNFYGGEISSNTAENGGGIYNAGTFTVSGGKISDNTAITYGGGVYNSGTAVMSNGEIVGNVSQNGGGGIYSRYGGNFTLTNGTISNNTASNGGGLYANSAFIMNGGEITNNTASNNGGGVFVNGGSFSVSGKVIIAKNALKNGVVCNYATAGAVPITVAGALNGESRVGIFNEVLPLTATSGYGAKTGSNAASLARTVFSADAEGVVAVYENSEIVLKQGVVLTVNDDNGEKIGSITTVNGATVNGAFDEEKRVYTLAESGAVANTSGFAFASDVVPEGYAAYMYAYGDVNKAEISSYTMGTENATVCLTKKALERDYTIHYYVQSADGSYGTTFITGTHSGPTDSAVVVLDENGRPFTTQITTPEQYALDEAYSDWKSATVAGDGSTVVDVYLKLKEYTVNFDAGTAGLQTFKVRYGAKLSSIESQVREPYKIMNTFAGWYTDEACTDGNEVNFASFTVTENVKLYAKFDTQNFKVTFKLNLGTGANQLDKSRALNRTATGAQWLESGYVEWNASGANGLFDDSGVGREQDKFNFHLVSEGIYEISYNINNIPQLKRLTIEPKAIGYDFKGWFVSDTATTKTTILRAPNENTEEITLTARWEPTKYSIKLDKRNGQRVTTVTPKNFDLWGSGELDDNGRLTGVLPKNPTRDGFVFTGWYATEDWATAGDESFNIYASSTIGGGDAATACFSIKDFTHTDLNGLYGNAADGYNFTNLTLYAGWKREVVTIVDVTDEEAQNTQGYVMFVDTDGNEITPPEVTVGETVRFTLHPETGYEFDHILVNGAKKTVSDGTITVNGEEVAVKQFALLARDTTRYENELRVEISAVFKAKVYNIKYFYPGATADFSGLGNIYTYTIANVTEGGTPFYLPSKLIKRGYNFMGWQFIDGNPAFDTSGLNDLTSLYGEELPLVSPVNSDGEVEYRDLTLSAVWEAQPASVNLYYASYDNLGELGYEDMSAYIRISQLQGGVKVRTGDTIDIVNPDRSSFDFIGWATVRNGLVVYPLEYDDAGNLKNTISYTVNADLDENGEPLNRNNLYAVWHVAGVDYVNITATGNETTYGGDGIAMTALPAQNYKQGADETITLKYYWYKVYDYDKCFDLLDYVDTQGRKLYVDADGNVVAYLLSDGVTVTNLEGATIDAAPEGSTIYQYKKFKFDEVETLKAAGYLEEMAQSPERDPSIPSTYTVHEVADCGTYICYVAVKGSVGGGETRDGGFGEIKISMSKAEFGGITLTDKQVSYDGDSKADEIKVSAALGATVEVVDGVTYIVLPDKVEGDKAHAGSRLMVTYRYYKGVGTERQEITDLSKIRDVGTYYVVASFAFTPDGDNGNYELIQPIEAVLEITPFEIGGLKYTFTHDNEPVEGNPFSGVYDGKAYGVKVEITDNIDGSDVSLNTKIYTIADGTNNESEFTGEYTVRVGNYVLVVTGLGGADEANFALSETAKLRQEYSITRAKYDFADSIVFDGKEIVFDGEMHTVEIAMKDGKTLPETVKVTYKTEFAALIDGYTPDDNKTENGNGGKHAGVYTVTASFADETNGSNYEAIEDMTATLVINRENLFTFYNKDGADLLRDGGFVNASYAYEVGKSYDPYISSGLLAGSDFSVTYEYYKVNETDGTKTLLGSGKHSDLEGKKLIETAGKYEIIAKINYEGKYYANNFEAVKDSEATITYVIREVAVESVSVAEWTEGVTAESYTDADGNVRKYYLGEPFDHSHIKQINVVYAGSAGTLKVTGDDIKLAVIGYEQDGATVKSALWHVGEFKIKVAFYGTDSEEYTFKVVEKVTRYDLEYSTDDGNSYEPVPERGLEQLTGVSYKFRVVFNASTANSETKVRMDLNATYESLVLGENALTLADSDSAVSANYEFGDVKVNIYKVFNGDDIVWKYSVDGGSLQPIGDEPLLPYIGKEYKIFATFTDDNEEQSVEATAANGRAILNAGNYLIKVADGGKYLLKVDSYSLAVEQRALSFDWSNNPELVYNTHFQTPKAEITNLCEGDEGQITLGYIYRDADGNRLDTPSDEVVSVGEYAIEVYTLSGDATANYTLAGAVNAEYVFNIVKAELDMTAVYNEYNYGRNVTYAENVQGLRLDAVKADFGTNSVVAGNFVFITGLQEDGSYTEVAGNSSAVKALLKTASKDVKVPYAYVPVDQKNYKIKTGELNLNVLAQVARSGEGSLSVEFGEGSKTFYLVGNAFSTFGIKVNRLYQSTYKEGGEWFGYRREVSNPTFLIGNIDLSENEYVITDLDVSSRKIVLTARYGSSNGTLDVPVLNDKPTGVSIVSTDHKTTFYVGEPYAYDDIKVEVTFEKSPAQTFTSANGVISLKEPVVFTDADVESGKTVTFVVFEKECDLHITVEKPSEITFKGPANKVFTYTGEVLEVPQITFVVGGVDYAELEGVTIDRTVVYDENNNPTEFKEDGNYTIRYYFTKTNYAYELSAEYFDLKGVQITSNPYKVTITEPAGEKQVTYDGKAHEIPQPTISEVTDTLHGNEVVDSGNVTVKYQIYKKGATPPPATENPNWTVTDRGEYIVKIEVYVKGYAQCVGSLEYGYVIEQAENEITGFEVPAFVVEGDGYDFEVEATFGKNKAELRYDKTENGTFTKTAPDSTGIWFVKVTIPEDTNKNYKEVSQVKSFEVRAAEVADGENSVSGGDGVGSGWTLEVSEDDVSEVSISQQEVLGGYEVLLKDGNGNVQKNASKEYTVRIKLSEELAGKGNLKVFFYDEHGNASAAQGVKVDADGFLEFKTKSFGRFIITNEIPVEKQPVGLLVAVIILGVVAAGGIAACVAVFLKKRKKGGAR